MDNPETQAILDNPETQAILDTRHRPKTNTANNIYTENQTDEQQRPHQKPGVTQMLAKGRQVYVSYKTPPYNAYS